MRKTSLKAMLLSIIAFIITATIHAFVFDWDNEVTATILTATFALSKFFIVLTITLYCFRKR
ncbi:archaellum biogenesis protein FlaJ (TadC family) [Dysgonomonadaceae bacterium PH5-43]|nr:archaellum biogenesis protein FlaJ (TadC family) [Dysgonomonadaceae bacterium PH5-43]